MTQPKEKQPLLAKPKTPLSGSPHGSPALGSKKPDAGSPASSYGAIKSTTTASPRPPLRERLAKQLLTPSALKLGGMIMIAIIIGTANGILWKRTLNRFIGTGGKSMEFFVAQFTVILFLLMSGSVVIYLLLFTDKITAEQRTFPLRKFGWMAFLDALGSLLCVVGGSVVTGQLQTLINQSSIPITMIISYVLVSTRYVTQQYFGALLIMAGAAVSILPHFFGGPTAAHSSPTGILIYLSAMLPMAYSSVYKEGEMKAQKIDVYYMSTWIALLQWFIGFSFAPIMSLPAFGGVPLSEIPNQMVEGFNCFLGRPVEGFRCDDPTLPSPMFLMVAFTSLNFFSNVLYMYILREGSAMLMVIAGALNLPIMNIAYSMPVIMGSEAETFSMANVCGLVVVIVGFLLYSLVQNDEGEVSAMVPTMPGNLARMFESRPRILRTVSLPAIGSPALGSRSPMSKRTAFASSPNLSALANGKNKRTFGALKPIDDEDEDDQV